MSLVLLSCAVEAFTQRKQADIRLRLIADVERKTFYYSKVLEDFSYGKEIRINNMGNWLIERENAHWNKGYNAYQKYNALGIKSGVFNSFSNFVQQAVAYAYLLGQVLSSSITIGDFSMYVAGVAAFSSAVRSLLQNVVEVSVYRKYYDAIDEYLNIPAIMRQNKGLQLPNGEYTIQFCNVSFRYPGQPDKALDNISVTLRPGQTISIVGENGAGKTTFVKLLCRIYDPCEGEILLNGVNIKDIDYEQYTGLFSTVFQDFKLYALSLKDNVALSHSDTATDKSVESALIRAGFGEKLHNLPQGVYTLVYRNFYGEGYEPSRGGEGQKIALARALYRNASILILDEPAAALDPRAEYELYNHFDSLVTDKTAIYISHRLSSTRFCDKILVFQHGNIVEAGTHRELMDSRGSYSELYQMQAGYYTDIL